MTWCPDNKMESPKSLHICLQLTDWLPNMSEDSVALTASHISNYQKGEIVLHAETGIIMYGGRQYRVLSII
jgi:hypothetical protein